MPPIFSSNRIAPIGRSMPEVRADAELAEAAGARVGLERREQVVLAALGAARTRRAPARNSSSMPATSTPRGLDGIVKRMRPSAESSSGPVKTSPRGHVAAAVGVDPRAAVDAQRQVGALGLDAQLARLARAARSGAAWTAAQLAPGGRRVVAVEEQSRGGRRRRTRGAHARLLGAGRRRPQRAAPAPPHRRLADRRPGARRRGPSAPGRRRRAPSCSRAPGSPATRRCPRPRPARPGANAVEVLVARGRPEALLGAGQLDAQQRPGPALEQLALQREQQRRGERRRAHDDLLAGLRLEAVAAQQPAKANGSGQGASTSGKCSARCSRSTSRIQRRSSCVAKRKRASSSFCRVIGSVPAISQRTARRSNRNSTARCQASSRESGDPPRRRGVLAPRRGRHRAAQREHVAVRRRGTSRLGRGERRPPRPGAGCAYPSGPPRRAELRRDVPGERLGVARPGRAGAERRELADRRARLLGVVVEGRGAGRRGGPCMPVCGCRACRSSRTSARGRRARATARSGRARGRGGGRRGSRRRRRPPRRCRRSSRARRPTSRSRCG